MSAGRSPSKVFPPPCNLRDEICRKLFYSVADQEKARGLFYAGEDTESFSTKAARLSASLNEIETKRQLARHTLQRSKDTVFTRWKELTPTQRLSFFNQYCPDLRPNVFYDRMESGQIPTAGAMLGNSLLLSGISLNEMINDWKSYLCLMQNRLERGPESWVLFDGLSFMKQWIRGRFPVHFSTECVLTRGSTFGRLITWDAKKVHQRDAIPLYYMGLVVRLQDLITTYITNGIVVFTEGIPPSGKFQLWNGFVRNEAEQIRADDENLALVHALSMAPSVSVDTIMALVRARSEAQEDVLNGLQSNIGLFLERTKHHVDRAAIAKLAVPKERPTDAMITLLPQFQARVFWHLLLELLNRLRNVLAPENTSHTEEKETVIRDVNYAISQMLLHSISTTTAQFFSCDFGQKRLATLMAAASVKRFNPEQQRHILSSMIPETHLARMRPLAFLIGMSDAELLEKDWLAWSMDKIDASGTMGIQLQLFQRLLQYLRKHERLAKKIPQEVTMMIGDTGILLKVWEFLHYFVPGPLPVEPYNMPPENDACWMLWYAAKDCEFVEAAKTGGELDKTAAGLKLELPLPERDRNWLVRSDASYTQFAAVHRVAVNAFIQMLNNTKYRAKSTEPEHIQSLLLLHDSDELTPISASERQDLTRINLEASEELIVSPPSLETGPSPDYTPSPDHTPSPQKAKKTPKRATPTPSKRAFNPPNLRKLTLQPPPPPRPCPRPEPASSSSSKDPAPILLGPRAFRVAQQLFPTSQREGTTTFADIQVFMADVGFSCKQLPGSARLFQRRDGQAVSAVQGHKSITVHEPHKSKYEANQLDNLRGQMRRRFGWDGGSFGERCG